MSHKDTSALIDGIIRASIVTGVVGIAFAAPNAVQMLDKPLNRLLKHLDKNAQSRELERVTKYMVSQGLLRSDYEHGLQLTTKARERLAHRAHKVAIERPDKWDQRWRIVFYDIPETHKVGRNALSSQLREFGFWQLQRSVWIFPYPCRPEIEATTAHYGIDRFVTFLETDYLDNQHALIDKFKVKKIM